MDNVKNSLVQNNNVYLRGFGSFILKKRARKTARNISKNTTIVIPEPLHTRFQAGKSFHE
jgi:DNA-binding protein HU-beta